MVKRNRRMLAFLLAFVAGVSGISVKAEEEADGYFVSGKIYCHIIAKNEVEVCGLRVGKICKKVQKISDW